jgi:hypothetical protein
MKGEVEVEVERWCRRRVDDVCVFLFYLCFFSSQLAAKDKVWWTYQGGRSFTLYSGTIR